MGRKFLTMESDRDGWVAGRVDGKAERGGAGLGGAGRGTHQLKLNNFRTVCLRA